MATSALIGSLRVQLGLDSAQFEAGTKRARTIAKRDATAIQTELAKIRTGFNAMLTGVAAGALLAAGKRALDYAANLGEVAAAVGVTTKELQEYYYVGTQVNLTQEETEKLLAKLTKTMGEAAAGGKSQVAIFRELGLSLQDANGRFYTAGEMIPKIAEAMKGIESPAIRARILTDLFGRSGQKLEAMLAGGADGVNELRDAAHKLGVVLSDKQIQDADKTADKLAELKKVLEARIAGVIADNAQAIYGLANSFAALANAAAQVSAKVPGALSILTGAAVGGRVAGGPGALAGGLTGLLVAGADKAVNDPYGVRAMSDRELAQRARSVAKDVGSIRRSAGTDESQQLLANAAAIQAEIERRVAAAKAGKASVAPVVGEGALPTVTGGGGKKRGGGGERDRTAEYLERFNREMEGLRDEQLQLTIDQTASLDERAQLEAQRILNEREAYKIDIDNRLKAGELNAAQAEKLKIAVEQIAADKQALMWNDINAEKLKEQQRLVDASFDIRENALRMELDAARTQSERRNIELRLLDIEYEREKAALDHLKALFELGKATMAEVDAAENRVAAMDAARGGREAAIRQNTMGPLEQYFDSLPKSAAELNEAYQQVAAEGLQSLNDGIVDAIMNAKSLGDVFKNVANQIIADLIRIAVQKAITNAIGGVFGGGGLFGAIGGLFGGGGGAASLMGSISRVKGAATGGSFMVGGNPGVDRNLLSLNGIPQVRVSSSERVSITPKGQAAEVSPVQIVPSPYFDVVVDGRVLRTGGGLMRNQSQMGYRRARSKLA